MVPGPSRSHCPWDVCLVLVFLWLPFRPSAPSLCLSPPPLSLCCLGFLRSVPTLSYPVALTWASPWPPGG